MAYLTYARLCQSHTAAYLADVFCISLHEFGVIDQLVAVPGDSASTNTKMLQIIKGPGHLPYSHLAGVETQVQYASHIFNLANKV